LALMDSAKADPVAKTKQAARTLLNIISPGSTLSLSLWKTLVERLEAPLLATY